MHIMLSVIILAVFMLNDIVLSVIYTDCWHSAHYTGVIILSFANVRYAECRYTDFLQAEWYILSVVYTDCRHSAHYTGVIMLSFSNVRYAECHSTDCYYCKCHGACQTHVKTNFLLILLKINIFSVFLFEINFLSFSTFLRKFESFHRPAFWVISSTGISSKIVWWSLGISYYVWLHQLAS